MIRNILENSIKTALWELKIDKSNPVINLEHPEDLSHGDYSTNIAMVLAKQVAQNPRELAEKIVAEIKERLPKEISKIEVAGPGFINFYLSPEFFVLQNKEILKVGKKFGLNKNLKGERTIIEYTDPNPFKEFHIGHLVPNSIGESVATILEANGAKVMRACYQGDLGLHIAKNIWAILKDNSIKDFQKKTLNEKVNYLGKMYAKGAEVYENPQGNEKKEIEELNKKIYEKSEKEINKIYEWGRKVSLEYFDSIYKVLGTKFDRLFFESETQELGRQIVEKNIGKVFEKSNGAIIFKGENYGLHTRVFINSEGIPTYEAKDLGLAKKKYDFYHYDKSLIVTGNEQKEYTKVMLKAMSFVFPEFAEKTKVITNGFLSLSSGKMSSRTGKVVPATSLITDTENRVIEKMTARDINEKEKKEIAQKIAVGALKYSILKQVNGKDIVFDFDKSLSFEGDSGPYLQYSYARAKSILRKAKEERVKSRFDPSQIKSQFDWASINILEKLLYRFPEIVERAGNEYSPHYIATYLIELASSFNSFYATGKIVDKKDAESSYKVALTEAFSIVLKNGLNLLGIQAPEKM